MTITSTNSAAPDLILPPTPHLPPPNTTGYVDLPTGNTIWYATFGPSLADTLANQRIPIIFLHGALANSDWWGHQIVFLLRHYANHAEDATTLITIDLRFLGRSTYGPYTAGGQGDGDDECSFPVTFALKTADTIAVLDHLAIPRAAAVGWSNGATVLVDLLTKHPARIERALLHAGFFDADASLYHSPPPPPPSSASPEYEPRTLAEMLLLSQRPDLVPAVRAAYGAEYAREPHWGPTDFARIPARRGGGGGGGPLVWFVEGQWEEVVVRGTAAVMAGWVPGSEVVVFPGVSHYAHIQDPEQFNAELLRFLRA
ncbi:hypothetical protein PspLS_05441 [Pyricularia sp. CBS 133598]|nr:hypothetical protein PspLS_05441 [Pyricularia sp. CBS 133598]